MTTEGRTLHSASQSSNTGMHADLPGLGAGAQFTVFFAFKDLGNNTNNTLWADQNGGCQLYINSPNGAFSGRYANSGTGGGSVTFGPGWNFVAVRMGLNIGGTDDCEIELYRSSDGQLVSAAIDTTTSGGPQIEAASRHYLLGDDAGGGNTDDGVAAKVFGVALIEGLWTLDQLGCDTATGQAKAFDPAAEAAIFYALRGQSAADPGNDDSGNGRAFTIESGGVVYDEADLPPGVSLPAEGGTDASSAPGAGVASGAGSVPGFSISASAAAGTVTGAAVGAGGAPSSSGSASVAAEIGSAGGAGATLSAAASVVSAAQAGSSAGESAGPTISASVSVVPDAGAGSGAGTVSSPSATSVLSVAPDAGTATGLGNASSVSADSVTLGATGSGSVAGAAPTAVTADRIDANATPATGAALGSGLDRAASISSTSDASPDAGTAMGTGEASVITSGVRSELAVGSALGQGSSPQVGDGTIIEPTGKVIAFTARGRDQVAKMVGTARPEVIEIQSVGRPARVAIV